MRKKRLFGDVASSTNSAALAPSCWLKGKTAGAAGAKKNCSKSGVQKAAVVVDNSSALKHLDMLINQAKVRLVEPASAVVLSHDFQLSHC